MHPPHKLLCLNFSLDQLPKRSLVPLSAITFFTDGLGKTHKSAITWWDKTSEQWLTDVSMLSGSPQIVELAAVVRIFRNNSQPLNLVTNSVYVTGTVQQAEAVVLKNMGNLQLFSLLQELVFYLDMCLNPYFVIHIHSHASLPGFSNRHFRGEPTGTSKLTAVAVRRNTFS